MDSIALAKELAWLIKDNLPCKHLVLSAEEAFVTFLDPQQTCSAGKVLTLKPMAAYDRMLLHRLADIFRLAHESIGEGEERHLVLERCEDSCIPEVLVSDILECNENTEPQCAPIILKRTMDYADVHKYTGAQSSQISFEERQAAYLAARERIFSEDLSQSANESAIPRPRSVPVVARRMIAHALGKRILAEQDFKTAAVITEPTVTGELDTTCSSLEATELREQAKVDTTCSSLEATELREQAKVDTTCAVAVNSSADDANSQVEHLKIENLQAKAAKRMFAQALGLGSSKSSNRVPSRSAEKKTDSLQPVKSNADVKETFSPGADSSNDPSCQPGAVGTAQLERGKAAQRMLAQALGFRSLSIVAEKSKKS